MKLLVPAIAIALLAAACGPAPTTGTGPAATGPAATAAVATPKVPGGTVTIRLPGDWGNPIDGGPTVTSAYGIMLSGAMYDTLIYHDLESDKLEPYLARSWEVKPTSVTFKLRDDATCSDGTRITPTVVHDSFKRALDPALKSRWVSTTFGPGPFTLAKDDAAGTFTLSTAKAFAPLLQGFADNRFGILCPKGLVGADFTKESHGSGPYVFESAIQANEYVMKKREGWNWGPKGWKSSDSGFPEKIVVKVMAAETTAANSLLTKAIDITGISGPDVTRLKADPAVELRQKEGGAPYVLWFNQSADRPTASPVIRKAVATALDPKAWTIAAGSPDAPISTNIHVNPGGYCYTDLSAVMPKPSVETARKILTDAGYTAGAGGKLQKDGKPLGITVTGTGFTGSGVEYIADTLEKVGFTVNLINTDYNTFAQNFSRMNFDVLIGLFGGFSKSVPTSTPLFMFGKTTAEGGNNRTGANDPKIQELVERAFGAPTEAEACQAWKEFNTYSIQNSMVLPWASSVTFWFSRKGEFSYQPVSSYVQVSSIRRLK